MLELSPSKIQTYMTCPLSYYFRYVEKIKTITNGRAWMGTSIHKSIGNAVLTKNLEGMTKENLIEDSKEKFINFFRNPKQEIDWKEDKIEDIEKEGISLINTYLNNEAFNKLSINQLELSLPFEFGINNELKQIDLHTENKQYKMNCYIDALGLDFILDWKTSKRLYTEDQVIKNIQFTIYAMTYMLNTGLTEIPIKIHVLVTKKNPEIQTFDIIKTESDFYRLKNDIFQIIRAIENDIYYANPNMLCENYCDYKSLCRFQKNNIGGCNG